MTRIYHIWLYTPGVSRDRSISNSDYYSFEMWLWIEVLMVMGQVISAAVFTLLRQIMNICNKDEYIIKSFSHAYMGKQSDFLTYWTNHLGLVTLNVQPCVILAGMKFMPHPTQKAKENGHEDLNWLGVIIFVLCCIQSLFLLIGLFISARTRRKSIYNKCCDGSNMPIVKKGLVYSS